MSPAWRRGPRAWRGGSPRTGDHPQSARGTTRIGRSPRRHWWARATRRRRTRWPRGAPDGRRRPGARARWRAPTRQRHRRTGRTFPPPKRGAATPSRARPRHPPPRTRRWRPRSPVRPHPGRHPSPAPVRKPTSSRTSEARAAGAGAAAARETASSSTGAGLVEAARHQQRLALLREYPDPLGVVLRQKRSRATEQRGRGGNVASVESAPTC